MLENERKPKPLEDVLKKDKLIAFEDWIGDALAYLVARIIIRVRRCGR